MRVDRVSPPPAPSRRSVSPREASSNETPEPKEWTILGFFNGNNDLEPAVTQGIIDAEKVGRNDKVSFVAQLARAPQKMVHTAKGEHHDHIDGDWAGVRRYQTRFTGVDDPKHIRAKLVEKMPDYTDMGSPDALADFLRWGVKNYPAKHYMVVVNNHGAGFRGVSFDEVHDSHLDPGELRQVLDQVKKDTGVKPDVILFDACEMGQAEVAYELRNSAKYLVGGEDLIGAAGMPYSDILSRVAFDEHVSGREMAKSVVEASANDELDRQCDGRDEAAGQFAAVDLSRMDDLRKACDHLSRALRKGGIPRTRLVEVVKRTKRFQGHDKPERDFRDLGDFANNLVHSRFVKDERIKTAAQQVLDVLDEVVVAHQSEGEGMSRTHGLSIYLPTDGGRDPEHPRRKDPFGYGALDMSKDSEWPALIAHMHPKKAAS